MPRFIVYTLTALLASVVDGVQVSVRVGSDVPRTENGEVQPTEAVVDPVPETPRTEAGADDGREDPETPPTSPEGQADTPDGEVAELPRLPRRIRERLHAFDQLLGANPALQNLTVSQLADILRRAAMQARPDWFEDLQIMRRNGVARNTFSRGH